MLITYSMISEIKKENIIIRGGIILYWFTFWLLTTIDKVIPNTTFLWAGQDRLAQYTDFFLSLGVPGNFLPYTVFIIITSIEAIIFLLYGIALFNFFRGNFKKAHIYFFYGTVFGLIIFSISSIGDQMFGDRAELLEHTTYWISLIISWGAYVYLPRANKYLD